VKIANVLFGLQDWQTLIFVGLLNVVFAAHSGLWGVLVIDMVQFFIKMTAVIAAAYFAVQYVGGLDALVHKVSLCAAPPDKPGLNYLDMLPSFDRSNEALWDLAVAVFIIPITIQWWASWYPGAEPGGGSYIAQRMLASKSEKDSLGGVLFFNVAHYVLRPWPWILVGLCSLVVFPSLADIRTEFPGLDPKWLDHDIAYPAMVAKVLPVGWMGLMVAGLIAANSSTILTHLNWGASYLVHDFYRRFLRPGAPDRHYVLAGRVATVGLFFGAAGMMYLFTSAKQTFELIMQIGAGTGLIYILRWFWWRITAWCEVAAMISSFAVSVLWLVLHKAGIGSIPLGSCRLRLTTHVELVLTVAFTTVCWLLVAYLGPATDRAKLLAFYRQVRPFGPGWRAIRAEAGPSAAPPTAGENLPLALIGWVSGCTVIWSALFTVGNFLYGRMLAAGILLAVFAVGTAVLIAVINRLWTNPAPPAAVPSAAGTRRVP
jgi:Na+/proline symporter